MINDALRTLRIFNNLKQYEAAERLGISKSHISEIEKGTKKPSYELLEKYSEVFNTPLSSILFFSENYGDAATGNKIKSKFANSAIKLLNYISRGANE